MDSIANGFQNTIHGNLNRTKGFFYLGKLTDLSHIFTDITSYTVCIITNYLDLTIKSRTFIQIGLIIIAKLDKWNEKEKQTDF